eukprot:scaffold1580_cov116-Cylindrotheca_fusiformis.AAC.10
MSQRSIEYNNAGVDCIEAGQHRMAWDLFKGALEVKLSLELVESKATGNGYIEKAEKHFISLKSRMYSCESSDAGLSASTRSQSSATWESFNSDPSLYSPFLFTDPIRLDAHPRFSAKRESAAIIFNLALADHLKSRRSEQAVALYELAMTLLTGTTVDFLGIALMNNIGVWCYDNGDTNGSINCMAHLSCFITAMDCEMTPEQIEGVQTNILWLANPPFPASPAA